MRKVILCCILSLLFALPLSNRASAQKVNDIVIEGTAEFAKGEDIRLVIFDDLLTYTPKTVATAKISKAGKFSLKYKATQITLAQLVIRTSKAEFFLVPGRSYYFDISMDEQLFQLLDPEYYGGVLHLKPSVIDTNDLNYKIFRFANFYNRITDYFQDELLYRPSRDILDTIEREVAQRFGLRYQPDNFYLSYIYYSVASTDLMINQKYPKQLYEKYFDNEYLLYDNPAYMNFFNGFYDQYLLNSHFINQSILGKYINDQPDYLALFNEVGRDPLLVNERIRELVIIKNLGQFYDNEEFDQRNILQILDYIQQSTRFPAHKKIIDNVKNQIFRMRSGTDFPYVNFKEASGANFNLKKLQGKWVYLQIFNSSCEDCIRNMLILKKLQETYPDKLAIVSLSVDFDESKFVQFVSRYGEQFPWSFIHFNDQYEWLANLEIGNLPDNLLISPNGKLMQRYAPDADRDLPRMLQQMFPEEEIDNNPMFRKTEN